MKLNTLNQFQISLLGAFDGLLIGVVLEGIRLLYAKEQLNRELAEAATYHRSIGYILEPQASSFLPLLSIVALAVASLLVHRYFVSRPKLLLKLWVALGAVSTLGAYYMAPIGSAGIWSVIGLFTFVSISFLVYFSWVRRPKSPTLLWPVVGITAVVVTLGVAQTVGLFRVQRTELRVPLAWLMCLMLVVGINVMFGAVLGLVKGNYSWSDS
jgi:hypothetical protein